MSQPVNLIPNPKYYSTPLQETTTLMPDLIVSLEAKTQSIASFPYAYSLAYLDPCP